MDSGSRMGQRSVGYRFVIAALIALGLNASVVAPAAAQSGYTPVTVQFSASNYTISESGGVATITVTLSQASTSDVQVNYATSDGTAVAKTDYLPALGTLDFPPGTTSQTFLVSVIDNGVSGPSKTVNLTLSNPVNASLGMPWQATLTILDDDPPQVTVQFSTATYTASESSPSTTITVTLSQTTTVPVTVEYFSSDGTAISGTDYTAVRGLLTFNPGDTQQTFQVPIIDDGMIDPNETVNLTLQYPTNASLGSPSTAVLTIMDNHPPVTVTFSPSPVLVQPSGTASLTATVSPSNQSASVTFTSSDSTIATVTGSAPNLTVTGVATGTAQINAMVGQSVVGSVTVYVVTVSFSPNPVIVPAGQTTPGWAVVTPSDAAQYLTYSIANTTIASMTGTAPNFTVTGVATGSTSITATNGGVTFGTGAINVVNTNVTVTFSPSPIYVASGQSVTATATITPTSAIGSVTFSISDTSIATLSGVTQTSTGATMIVTGGTAGLETTLVATFGAQPVANAPVKVPNVVFNPDPVVVGVGFTGPITATVTPADSPVTFDTADKTIATVAGKAPNLTITGVAAGQTTVRANLAGAANNPIKTAKVIVAQATFKPNPVYVAKNMTAQVNVTVTPGGLPTPPNVTFDTADGSIASVVAVATGPIVTVKGIKDGSTTQLRAKYGKNIIGTVDVKVFAATGLDATLAATKNPTGDPVPTDLVALGQTLFHTTSSATNFNPNGGLMVVVKDAGPVLIALQGSANLSDAITAGAVKYQLDRNPQDKVATGLVTFAGMGLSYTLTPDNPGNFRLTFYYDQNANGQYDQGEELIVLPIGIVRVTLQLNNSLTYNKAALKLSDTKGDPVYGVPQVGFDTGNVPMNWQAPVLLEGGGVDGLIGVPQVTIGAVGNLTADTQTCTYPADPNGVGNALKVGTATEDPDYNQNPKPGFKNPMVDTSRVAPGTQPTGGISAFRRSYNLVAIPDQKPANGIGVIRTTTAFDPPGFGDSFSKHYKKNHPTTGNIWGSTSGGLTFTDYVTAHSSSFERNYYVLGSANWSINWIGQRGANGLWTDNGSNVSGDATFKVIQKDGTSAGIQVLGYSYAVEYGFIYAP